MFPFPLKTKFEPSDIITESVMLLASLVLLVSFRKISRDNDNGRVWRIALAGLFFFTAGTMFDLLDEFFKLPSIFPRLIENVLLVTGISIFSFGMVHIIRSIIGQASRDPLTGLFNRSHLKKALAAEIERSRRYKTPLSLLFIDINDFKRINDRMGHAAGDVFLARVAGKIKQAVRAVDIPARYGGDEFVVIMPQTEPPGAELLLKRIREAVSSMESPDGGQVGVSGGMAAFPADGDDPDLLINLADKRMYGNKRGFPAGRE